MTPFSITSRILAAIIGGYLLAAAFTVICSFVLPLQRSEAVLTSSLLSFIVYVTVVIFVFAARSATLAWLWTLGPAALLGLIALGLGQPG